VLARAGCCHLGLQFGALVVLELGFGDDACWLEQDAAIFVLAHHEALTRVSGKHHAAASVSLDEGHEVLLVVARLYPTFPHWVNGKEI